MVDGMRILYVTYYYLPHVGGGTWFPYHVSRRLARRGHAVTLLAPRVRFRLLSESVEDPPEPRLRVLRLNARPLPVWIAPFAAFLLLRPRWLHLAKEVDVVIGQSHPHHSLALGAVLLGKIVGRPVGLRLEDWRRWMFGSRPTFRTRVEFLEAGPVSALNEWAAAHADLLWPVSVEAVRSFSEDNASGPRVSAVNNGVDLEAIQALPGRSALRQRLALPAPARIIVYVGRFSGSEYLVSTLLDAFESVRRSFTEALLVLVGDELDEPSRRRHADAIRSGALRVVGPVPQTTALEYTAAADVAVGPLGPTATTPLKVLEALAVKTPVLLGRGSTGPELRELEPWLTFVEPRSAALAQALTTGLASSSFGFAKDAAPDVSRFGWDAVTTEVERGLVALTGQPQGQGGGKPDD